ncbi:MAG: glycosyltransferase family 4 protein [Synergistaceae bacterium]|nr:glycosyltransferase family 4 protein [Synergistaceae bacterium]
MKKQKIAVIGAKGLPSSTSGIEIYVEKVCPKLAEKFDVTVFSRKRYCSEIVKNYKGVRVIHIPSINTKHLDAISYTVFATVTALIMKYDVFWYHALGPAVTMFMPHMFSKKIISTVHGLDWKREKFGQFAARVLKHGEHCIAEYADDIIVLNRYDAGHFAEKWGRHCRIIPNGTDRAAYHEPEIISEKYGLARGEYILYMARIAPEKGLHTLIEAFIRSGSTKKLVIAGSGVHTNNYVQYVRDMAAGNSNIIFTGHVHGQEKAELYSNAYAYVLPSTIEGQSIGLLEAMSYGLPCIVSDIPENLDVIGTGGMSFHVNHAEDLAEKLRYAVENEAAVNELGRTAKAIVETNHNWERSIALTIDIISEITYGGGGNTTVEVIVICELMPSPEPYAWGRAA